MNFGPCWSRTIIVYSQMRVVFPQSSGAPPCNNGFFIPWISAAGLNINHHQSSSVPMWPRRGVAILPGSCNTCTCSRKIISIPMILVRLVCSREKKMRSALGSTGRHATREAPHANPKISMKLVSAGSKVLTITLISQ